MAARPDGATRGGRPSRVDRSHRSHGAWLVGALSAALLAANPAAAVEPAPSAAPTLSAVCGAEAQPSGHAVLFRANDGIHGSELWVTDGTPAGTRMVVDIDPRPGTVGAKPLALGTIGGVLYFEANDGVHGKELWRSDGSEAGTWLVADIRPDGSSHPSMPVQAAQALVVTAEDGVHGRALWAIDETTHEPTLLDGVRFSDEAGELGPADASGVVYLVGTAVSSGSSAPLYGDLEPWRTDGTPGGTWQLAELNPNGPSDPWFVGELGGSMLIEAADGTGGRGVWATDGTPSGTVRLLPGRAAFIGVVDGVGYAVADDGVHGRELWRTDGTPSGTRMVIDLNPAGRSRIAPIGDAGGRLVFLADDGVHGRSLWSTDGSRAGTRRIPGVVRASFSDVVIPRWGSRLFFIGRDALHGDAVWRTDGTARGTLPLVLKGEPSDTPELLEAVGPRLWFLAPSGPDRSLHLWTSDGTPRGTHPVTALHPGDFAAFQSPMAVGSRMVFVGPGKREGTFSLWATDGTSAGTGRVSGIGYSAEPTAVDGVAYYANGGLWRSDGTPSGTSALTEAHVTGWAPIAVSPGASCAGSPARSEPGVP